MTTIIQPEFVNEIGASTITGISAATLRTYRCRGSGPPFYKPAKQVLYKVDELRAWVENARRVPKHLLKH